MTAPADATPFATWLAIDIAKHNQAILIEKSDGKQRCFHVASSVEEQQALVNLLRGVFP